ncbi:hypothetical protein HY570_04165 [Candidatus Micrarchaeota archaeon]|nr:hypothetical protein [Candidatus Micrarchaeota archaeon]
MGNGAYRQKPEIIRITPGETFSPDALRRLESVPGIGVRDKVISYYNRVNLSQGGTIKRPRQEYERAMIEGRPCTIAERLEYLNNALTPELILKALTGQGNERQDALRLIAAIILRTCKTKKEGEPFGLQFIDFAVRNNLISESFKQRLTTILFLPGLEDAMIRHPLARDIRYENRSYSSEEAINTFFRGVFSKETVSLLVNSLTPAGSYNNWRENPNLGTFTLLVGDTLLTIAIFAKPIAAAGKAGFVATKEIAVACNLVIVDRVMAAAERSTQAVARVFKPLEEIATTINTIKGGKETLAAIKTAFASAKEWKGFALAGFSALLKGGWFATKTTLKTGFMVWLYSPELQNLYNVLTNPDATAKQREEAVSRFKGAMGLYELGFGLFNKALSAGNQKYQDFIRSIYQRVIGDRIIAAKFTEYLKQYMTGTITVAVVLNKLEGLLGIKFGPDQVKFISETLTRAKERSGTTLDTVYAYFKGKATKEQLETSLGFKGIATLPYTVGGALGLSWLINSLAETKDKATTEAIRSDDIEGFMQRTCENAMRERQTQLTVTTPRPPGL